MQEIHLQEANAGKTPGIAWVLRFAYGIHGPTKRQNLKILKDLSGPYNQANQARPPPFHPALQTLLSNQQVRIKLSSRAQPNGPVELASRVEERGWLGKLPERREKNMWWKWWHSEIMKINVPVGIEVSEYEAGSSNSAIQDEKKGIARSGSASSVAAAKRYGLPILKTQGLGLNHRVEQIINNRVVPKPPRRSPERLQQQETEEPPPSAPPQTRYYRRRYRDLLVRMPSLSFKPTPGSISSPPNAPETQQNAAKPNAIPGKYTVRISPLAATRGAPRNRVTYPIMRNEDREWVQRAQEVQQNAKIKNLA